MRANMIVKKSKTGRWLVTVILLVVTLLGGLVWIASRDEAQVSATEENNVLEEYVRLQKNTGALYSAISGDSPYVELYRSVEELKLAGLDEKTAISKAQDEYTEKKALCWYAEQSGISVTEKEVETYIEDVIREAKNADNYEEISNICKNENTSFEDTIYNNRELYKMRCLINKLYESEYQQFSGGTALSESKNEQWMEKWGEITAQSISAYKKSSEFAKIKTAVKESCKLIKNGEDRVNILKEQKIFY